MTSPYKKERLYHSSSKNFISNKESTKYSEATEKFIDTYLHQLRDGITLKTTRNPNENKLDSSGMSSYFEQGKNHYKQPPPIGNITATVTIHPFSSTDNDSYIRKFITLFEDVVKGSSITEAAVKIYLIRSGVVPGSGAFNLIQSSAFFLRDIGSDYEQFK